MKENQMEISYTMKNWKIQIQKFPLVMINSDHWDLQVSFILVCGKNYYIPLTVAYCVVLMDVHLMILEICCSS